MSTNKPSIYQVWYPKSRRFFWCVSPMPVRYRNASAHVRELWRLAHAVTTQLNIGLPIGDAVRNAKQNV